MSNHESRIRNRDRERVGRVIVVGLSSLVLVAAVSAAGVVVTTSESADGLPPAVASAPSVQSVAPVASVAGATPMISPASSVTSVPSVADLPAQFDRIAAGITAPEWIGYAVPMVAGDHRMCCWSGDAGGWGGCGLEEQGTGDRLEASRDAGPVRLEVPSGLIVLYRVERGVVGRIRMFSEDCAIDATGTRVHWLTGVSGAASVGLLGRHAAAGSRRVADGALAALAMHADGAALARLIAAAREGGTSHVRGQALFWLAQRAGDEAVGVISDAIRDDPDTQVKKRAVFALSQLPADEGVPRLIDLARANRNPVVRKQAFFWLGQSKDPRALAFFAEVLKQ
ncbi:MAG: HEAT repeat domain-containing protein [Vicinamibacterales bacterium]